MTGRFQPSWALATLALTLAGAAPAAAQDAAAGAATFLSACGVCHGFDKNRIGPNLSGVVGRKAGTTPGFAYSAAMKAYGKVWTPANLDAFLAAPNKAVPGTNMSFIGVKAPGIRAGLIAFLKTKT